jgi:hypothetical protein
VYTWSKTTLGINQINGINSPPPRYVCADEKFISVHGKKKPQFFAVCPECCLVVKQELLRNRDEPAFMAVFKELKRVGVKVCITDDWKAYAKVIKELGIRHRGAISMPCTPHYAH